MNHFFSGILPKGSVLVFSLIVLSIMLVTSLTLLSSSVLQRKASLSTANSTRSFQVADAGAEQVLYQLYQADPDTLQDVADAMSGAECSGGVVSDGSAGWTVRFYDSEGERIFDCDTDGLAETVASIKSEGSASGTIRAVEVAVAQASGIEQQFGGRYRQYSGGCAAQNPVTADCSCPDGFVAIDMGKNDTSGWHGWVTDWDCWSGDVTQGYIKP